uniref:hypothetical protein n=1 Tax=Rheinheimera sp. TaxID=1869214 RepID=UPI004047B5C8
MNYLQAHMVKANSATPLVVKMRGNEYTTDKLYNELSAEQKAAMYVAHELYQAFSFSKGSLVWAAIQFQINGITETEAQAKALARKLLHLGLLRWMGHDGNSAMYAISEKGTALVESAPAEERNHG